MEKYHIEKNTVQETLMIPLYGRKFCTEVFPNGEREESIATDLNELSLMDLN